MAEVYYAATGPYHWLKLHETHMQCVPFWINGVGPQGQKITQEIKGALEPIMLYRYVLPRDGVPIVLKTLGADSIKNQFGIALGTAALRKALGLQDIGDYMKENKIDLPNIKLPVSMDYLRVIPIGVKSDGEDRIMGPTGVRQEPI